jgi:Na+/melibiose symporter-like transporter
MPASEPTRADPRRVVAAEGASNLGSMLSRLAIPWVATLLLGAGPAAMALLLVADVAAAAVGALLLGPLIDRTPKRRAMVLCDLARGAVLALVALGAWRGWLAMPWLVAAAAAGGMLGVAFDLARSAWLAQCVPADELPLRNAQVAMAGSAAETAAFALGGWLYQALGAVAALAADAVSYLVSASLLRGVRDALPDARVAANGSRWRAWWREQREGWHVLLRDRRLRALAAIEALQGLAFSLAGTSYMVFVARDLGLPTGLQGMVFALGSVGAFAGAAWAPWLGRRLGAGHAMACGLALAALGAACVPLAHGEGIAAITLLAAHQIVGDAGQTVHEVHDRTLRQTAVGAPWLARVDAGLRGIAQGATLVGAALGALIGTAVSARSVLVLAAVAGAAAACCALVWLAPRRTDVATPASSTAPPSSR